MEDENKDDFDLPLAEFAPIIEESTAKNALLTTAPRNMKSEIPWITGLNAAEHLDYPEKFLKIVENKNLNLTEQFDVFLKKWLSYGFNISDEKIPAIATKIKEFYFGKGNSINKKNIKQLDLVIGDGIGAGHLDNLLSLFPSTETFPKRHLSPLDTRLSKKMVSLWTRFAKYGNFTPNEWEPYKRGSNSLKSLHISAEGFIQEEDLLKERANFWRSFNKNTPLQR
nr:PREDICTED: uncharacterized protein LOC109031879 [Bemisia tabaci]